MIPGALATIVAYLLGSIPFGYLLVRWKRGIDIRSTGSGGTGATNVMRSLGAAGFFATFFLDFIKGGAAVVMASRLAEADPRWIAAAGVAAIAGHIFPVWLKFRGGKGVATGVGVFVALAPIPMGLSLLLFVIVVAIWRYVSLGSILGTAAFPILFYLLQRPRLPLLLGLAMGASLIIARHHANIRRLLGGTETKVAIKKSVVRSQ